LNFRSIVASSEVLRRSSIPSKCFTASRDAPVLATVTLFRFVDGVSCLIGPALLIDFCQALYSGGTAATTDRLRSLNAVGCALLCMSLIGTGTGAMTGWIIGCHGDLQRHQSMLPWNACDLFAPRCIVLCEFILISDLPLIHRNGKYASHYLPRVCSHLQVDNL
jgi:hypothetical protein